MAPLRSYLIEATYQWIVSRALTPYLLVNATVAGVCVPKSYVQDGQIVFNISPSAVRFFRLEKGGIYFEASFGGELLNVEVPLFAVLAVYAKETGHGLHEREGGGGLWIDEDEAEKEVDFSVDTPQTQDKPKLKLV